MNNIVGMNPIQLEDLPQVVTSTFKGIESVEKKIKDSENQADIAKEKAINAHDKSAGWSFDGSKKREAIEALQEAAIEQSNALSVSIDASKMLFDYQQKLANSIQYLFALGVMNLAANRTVVRELELKLKNASKEKLSELARQEIYNVILQLRAQEDMFNRINGHDSLLRKHKSEIEQIQDSVNELLEYRQLTNNEIQQIQSSVEQSKRNVTDSLNQLSSKFTALEQKLRSSLEATYQEQVRKTKDEISNQFNQERNQITEAFSQLKSDTNELYERVEHSRQNSEELQKQLKKENEDFRTIINNELSSAIGSIEQQVNTLQKTFKHIEEDNSSKFSTLESDLSDKTNMLKDQITKYVDIEVSNSKKMGNEKNNELSTRIDGIQDQLNKKSFFDSIIYKIIIGLVALVALVLQFI